MSLYKDHINNFGQDMWLIMPYAKWKRSVGHIHNPRKKWMDLENESKYLVQAQHVLEIA